MPESNPKQGLGEAFVGLAELVRTLRGPGGCPWDAKQTFSTIKMYLIEEAYEVMQAVEEGDMEEVCSELGDLLFQVLFLARLGEEKGDFTTRQVLDRIREKMVRRHPHVFGKTHATTPEEVADNWARIKKSEKGPNAAGALGDIPVHLPALLRAHRLWERASKVMRGGGLLASGDLETVRESFETLQAAVEAGDDQGTEQALGALLFRLSGLSRGLGFNAEHLLRQENVAFVRRFTAACKFLRDRGLEPEQANAEQIEAAWRQAAEKETGQKKK